MKIILSPAKKMRVEPDIMAVRGEPVFLEDAKRINSWMKEQSPEELQKLWKCNDAIALQNYERHQNMDFKTMLTPAILSYDGIAYQYMAPNVFEYSNFDYVEENLRILSGFYGVLRPMDGVQPYRLEMQAKAKIDGNRSLYDYWGERIYREVSDESHVIINLASKEYSKCVEKYLKKDDRYITCTFGELIDGRVVQKGVYAKMARGQMVRFMAEHDVQETEQLKEFAELGYAFSEKLSDEKNYVFIMKDKEKVND